MSLPTFLGIGVPRSGTTWLHHLLSSHPEVYLPTRRKEAHYFDWYYDRGLSWYEGFFPTQTEASHYKAIGEISPQYLYCSDGPARIKEIPSIKKLILILRNPVDRLYSVYKLTRAIKYQCPDTFEGFLKEPKFASLIQESFYSDHLQNYLTCFSKDQLLILFFEEVFADVEHAKRRLAHFLHIDLALFPANAGHEQINQSAVPRWRLGSSIAMKFITTLHDHNLDWVVNGAHCLGIDRRLLGVSQPVPPMGPKTKEYLSQLYRSDIQSLELLLDKDLSCWR